MWNALLANCVTFGRDVASFLNVKMPPVLALSPSVMSYPKDLVDSMREANGLKQEQLPLRDAAASSPKKRTANGRAAEQLVSGTR